MRAVDICRQVSDAGMYIHADGDAMVIKPAERLSPELRALLVDNKRVVLQYLRAVESDSTELMARAMAVCDHHGDSDKARADMRADIDAAPAHLRADLLAHFQDAYGGQSD